MSNDKYIDNNLDDSVIDDSNLVQCEYCDYITDRDDIEYVNDPYCSDGKITRCPECNNGESFNTYKPKK